MEKKQLQGLAARTTSDAGFSNSMKSIALHGFILFLLLLMSGCAGTALRVQSAYQPSSDDTLTYVVVPNVEVSDEALSILRQELDSQLHVSGLLSASPAEARKSVEISITNYYMRHAATRALVGIMAGADNIQSSVQVKDKATQAVVGEFAVESKNPTVLGTSREMIMEHADKIVEYLRYGRP